MIRGFKINPDKDLQFAGEKNPYTEFWHHFFKFYPEHVVMRSLDNDQLLSIIGQS